MISFANSTFRLATEHTSYAFRITKFGHLEHLYYGARLPEGQPLEPFRLKNTAVTGGCVAYDVSDDCYCLDTMCLEWSGIGKGDYRDTPAEITMPDGTYTADFVYKSHSVTAGSTAMQTLPTAIGGTEDCQTLVITMLDNSNNVTLTLYYTVFEAEDVITRRAELTNGNANPLTIRRLLSLMVDLPNDGYCMITFDGAWIREAQRHDRALAYGILVNSSTTGDSSNRHNPGFLLAAEDTTETRGKVYGFNLIYSGNHYGAVELSNMDLVRVGLGINPYCFAWPLKQNETFQTPEAVMSFPTAALTAFPATFTILSIGVWCAETGRAGSAPYW